MSADPFSRTRLLLGDEGMARQGVSIAKQNITKKLHKILRGATKL